MECEIGEIKKVGNKWLQCIESACNKECYFYNRSLHKTIAGIDGNDFGACNACFRSDNKSVIFKELEKIGGPYDDCGIILQRFKIYTNVTNADTKGLELHIYSNNTIGIEIKENKKDMEEKNDNRYDGRMDEECITLCDILNSLPGVETTSSCCGHCKNDFMIFFNCNNSYSLAVISRAFNKRYSGTYLEWKIEIETLDNGRYDYFMHSVKPYPSEFEMKADVEQLIENLEFWKSEEHKEYFNYKSEKEQPDTDVPQEVKKKPFCLKDVKSGKSVCTRDGRKARIVCFDKNNLLPIVALVTGEDGLETVFQYYSNGQAHEYVEHPEDLMMFPEKKEGWINIYNADTTFYYADGLIFKTKDEAVQKAKEEVEKEQREKNEYIDTIRVEWEE